MRPAAGVQLYYAGDEALLDTPCVAVVGRRDASELDLKRARRLSRELVRAGATVVSGLASGVDTAAHQEAIACGGRTIAVIGTSLARHYPPENAALQQYIAEHHLVVSQVACGDEAPRGSFPARNRLMAALSDATVIVAAGDKSGTRHQAAACLRHRRLLFVCASLASDPSVTWLGRLAGPLTHVLTSTQQIVERLGRGLEVAP